MPTLFTIGWTRKPLKAFVTRLREAQVDAVIDIRLRNTSHLASFTKRDDLDFMLGDWLHVAYEHRPELAPTSEIFDAYRDDRDWTAFESRFLSLLGERALQGMGREILTRYRAPCLLCAEPTAERCHRRLVAEHFARHLPGLRIEHL
jgi:uncharacterized protein (DUF488 family)